MKQLTPEQQKLVESLLPYIYTMAARRFPKDEDDRHENHPRFPSDPATIRRHGIEMAKSLLELLGQMRVAVELEQLTGHTFRSPSRDTWPASLAELRKRFEAGYRMRGERISLDLHQEDKCASDDTRHEPCRVCRF